MIVHRVVEGPFEDPEGKVTLVCLSELNGEVFNNELYFPDFNTAYKFKNEFYGSIEPIVLEYSDDN